MSHVVFVPPYVRSLASWVLLGKSTKEKSPSPFLFASQSDLKYPGHRRVFSNLYLTRTLSSFQLPRQSFVVGNRLLSHPALRKPSRVLVLSPFTFSA